MGSMAVLRQVDRRRLHLHHPPPGDVDRQGDEVVDVGVRDEPGGRAHERPRLGAQIEADLELRDPPIRLHRRPGVSFDGDAFVGEAFDRLVVQQVGLGGKFARHGWLTADRKQVPGTAPAFRAGLCLDSPPSIPYGSRACQTTAPRELDIMAMRLCT